MENIPIVIGSAIIALIVKNSFEEFGFRGYLQNRLLQLTRRTRLTGLGTGLIWSFYFLPLIVYYNRPRGRPLFYIGKLILSSIIISFLLLWVFEKTNSIWPVVLLRTFDDLSRIVMVELLIFVQKDFFVYNTDAESILSMIIIAIITLLLFKKYRLKTDDVKLPNQL